MVAERVEAYPWIDYPPDRDYLYSHRDRFGEEEGRQAPGRHPADPPGVVQAFLEAADLRGKTVHWEGAEPEVGGVVAYRVRISHKDLAALY